MKQDDQGQASDVVGGPGSADVEDARNCGTGGTGGLLAPGTYTARLVDIGADGWVLVALGHYRPATVAELALRSYIDANAHFGWSAR